MAEKTRTLRDTRDERGSQLLIARLSSDGTLTIEGQDFGAGVEEIFGSGNREYEWILTIQPQCIQQLLSVLNFGTDVLAALGERFSHEKSHQLQPFLDEHGVPYTFWNRIGD